MFDKTKIFNLALAALFLQKRISNAETDTSTETLSLGVVWDTALQSALQEMDLDSTSQSFALELISTDPNELWLYAYKYPADAVLIRRIVSSMVTDDSLDRINFKTQLLNGQKVIMTNQQEAFVEYISKDTPIDTLSAEAVYFIALRLAKLAAPLVVGTNSKNVISNLNESYTMALLDAQRKDSMETHVYQPEWARSEFAKARLS
jgi:hypothetical protein